MLKHVVLKSMVWNMRWMTRYLGVVTRPFIKWYGDQEVIACGLRHSDGTVRIIYTPTARQLDHNFYKKQKRMWIQTPSEPLQPFSRTLVPQVCLPEARLGEVHRVVSRTKGTRKLRSPKITVKEKTAYDNDMIELNASSDGNLVISWNRAERYEAMIFFLAVEDDNGSSLSGVYTREMFWEYPLIKKASYSVGRPDPFRLEKGKTYTIKLVVVDFDGWVSALGEKLIVY